MAEAKVKMKVNDFVLRIATVNGSGSASSNRLLAMAIFRMGIPVGPKNIFPSNIQGMPTWYEIRVSAAGYTGRRGTADLVLNLNPASLQKDVHSVRQGGWLLCDDSGMPPPFAARDDITIIGVPFAGLAAEAAAADHRSLSGAINLVYTGVLAALLGVDEEILRDLMIETYGESGPRAVANGRALAAGLAFGKSCRDRVPLRVEAADLTGDAILLGGNDAAALGCVYGGATVGCWYPITPSTSLMDAFARFCRRFRVDPQTGQQSYAMVQAEDEIASIGMVLGAGWAGARAFTATSGPGLSLMGEFLGYAYYAEIPAVIFNVQRAGPSTGLPTRNQQADLLAAAFASHGDTRHLLLIPGTVEECFTMGYRSFDLAERFQTPVIVLSEIELAMNEYLSPPLSWNSGYRHDRGKVLDGAALENLQKPWYRYEDTDGDGIPWRTLPGAHPRKGANLTRGSGHDRYGRYTEDPDLYQDNLERLARKGAAAAEALPGPVIRRRDPAADLGLLYAGSVGEPVREALDILMDEGLPVNDLRVRAWPLAAAVGDFVREHRRVIVLDLNRDGQLRSLVLMEGWADPAGLLSLTCFDGHQPTAERLVADIKRLAGEDHG